MLNKSGGKEEELRVFSFFKTCYFSLNTHEEGKLYNLEILCFKLKRIIFSIC